MKTIEQISAEFPYSISEVNLVNNITNNIEATEFVLQRLLLHNMGIQLNLVCFYNALWKKIKEVNI